VAPTTATLKPMVNLQKAGPLRCNRGRPQGFNGERRAIQRLRSEVGASRKPSKYKPQPAGLVGWGLITRPCVGRNDDEGNVFVTNRCCVAKSKEFASLFL
jgi:hypothetical protein